MVLGLAFVGWLLVLALLRVARCLLAVDRARRRPTCAPDEQAELENPNPIPIPIPIPSPNPSPNPNPNPTPNQAAIIPPWMMKNVDAAVPKGRGTGARAPSGRGALRTLGLTLALTLIISPYPYP